jgi:hypothetical protein
MVIAIDIKFSCELPSNQTLNFIFFFFSKNEAYKYFKKRQTYSALNPREDL